MTPTGALRIVRLSAAYDLLVTAPFALPWTAALVLSGLAGAHATLGLGGAAPDPGDVFVLLFASLTGSVVTVWALVRLWRPSLALGLADSVARALFALAMVVALASGASTVVVGFLVPEILWGVVQAGAVLRAWRRAPMLEPVRA
ncbi:hypothetical protein [Isoptericola croceus]|uniref:hypothetical protein n=1 Tax=Isoptericola croceus TaxID=3031406 RepID=UPI0023F944B1|nr:hypothetical protein [Isoptericola croceus]